MNNKQHQIDNKDSMNIPEHIVESLARCLLPEIQKYFQSEEGQREFTEWQKKRGQSKKGNTDHE